MFKGAPGYKGEIGPVGPKGEKGETPFVDTAKVFLKLIL